VIQRIAVVDVGGDVVVSMKIMTQMGASVLPLFDGPAGDRFVPCLLHGASAVALSLTRCSPHWNRTTWRIRKVLLIKQEPFGYGDLVEPG
jgi:hypothetical protein